MRSGAAPPGSISTTGPRSLPARRNAAAPGSGGTGALRSTTADQRAVPRPRGHQRDRLGSAADRRTVDNGHPAMRLNQPPADTHPHTDRSRVRRGVGRIPRDGTTGGFVAQVPDGALPGPEVRRHARSPGRRPLPRTWRGPGGVSSSRAPGVPPCALAGGVVEHGSGVRPSRSTVELPHRAEVQTRVELASDGGRPCPPRPVSGGEC